MKKIFLFPLTLTLLLLPGACDSEDKESPKPPYLGITLGEEQISFENANIYWIWDGVIGTAYQYRYYVITDGTYITGKDGYSLEDFENASYFLPIEFAQVTTNFDGGTFPVIYSWGPSLESESNIGTFYFYNDKEIPYRFFSCDDDADSQESLIVSGGVNDGETIKITFDGRVHDYDQTYEVDMQFYFTGTVLDIRR